jgi:hypothetical protein
VVTKYAYVVPKYAFYVVDSAYELGLKAPRNADQVSGVNAQYLG